VMPMSMIAWLDDGPASLLPRASAYRIRTLDNHVLR
jgi:hypothetical protein